MNSSLIPLLSWITQTVFLLYYTFVAVRLKSVYEDLNIQTPNPIFYNGFLISFLIFAIINFFWWLYLKHNNKLNKKIKCSIFISLFFLVVPFVLAYLLSH